MKARLPILRFIFTNGAWPTSKKGTTARPHHKELGRHVRKPTARYLRHPNRDPCSWGRFPALLRTSYDSYLGSRSRRFHGSDLRYKANRYLPPDLCRMYKPIAPRRRLPLGLIENIFDGTYGTPVVNQWMTVKIPLAQLTLGFTSFTHRGEARPL